MEASWWQDPGRPEDTKKCNLRSTRADIHHQHLGSRIFLIILYSTRPNKFPLRIHTIGGAGEEPRRSERCSQGGNGNWQVYTYWNLGRILKKCQLTNLKKKKLLIQSLTCTTLFSHLLSPYFTLNFPKPTCDAYIWAVKLKLHLYNVYHTTYTVFFSHEMENYALPLCIILK
jgi:hypothetical protein